MADDTLDARIRERAYQIWQDEGQPEGREAEHWDKARAEFEDAQREAAAAPAKKRPRAAAKTDGAKPATKARKPAATARKKTKS